MLLYKEKREAALQMNDWAARNIPFVFFIDYKQSSIYLSLLSELSEEECLFNFNGRGNLLEKEEEKVQDKYWNPHPISYPVYKDSFDYVIKQIKAGNSYLVNLTAKTPIETNFSLKEIFVQSKAKYKLWLKDRFVVFSPETFVQIRGGFIYTYPMKGTIDASIPNALSSILEDEKESAEHATIVDLLRNDLSIIAKDVTVTRYRYIDELVTQKNRLLQVSSEIRGQLPADWKKVLGTSLFKLLPAGSITGAPKPKTQQIIAEAEHYDRGFYTGVMGVFDGETLDSAVMIRFVEKSLDGSFSYKSGGGITAQSDCRKEYEELIQKIYVPIR